MELESRPKKVLPKYMRDLDGENKTKEERDQLWQDLINESENKLIFVDCHLAWCGPCEVGLTFVILFVHTNIWIHAMTLSLVYYGRGRCDLIPMFPPYTDNV